MCSPCSGCLSHPATPHSRYCMTRRLRPRRHISHNSTPSVSVWSSQRALARPTYAAVVTLFAVPPCPRLPTCQRPRLQVGGRSASAIVACLVRFHSMTRCHTAGCRRRLRGHAAWHTRRTTLVVLLLVRSLVAGGGVRVAFRRPMRRPVKVRATVAVFKHRVPV